MPAPLKDDAGRTKWIDVWMIEWDDGYYITDKQPLTTHQRETITKLRMTREEYGQHPDSFSRKFPAPPEDSLRAGGT